ATVAGLIGLTAVIWITQSLKELDLVTGKGQTIIVFLLVTLTTLPALIAGIAPVALFAATLYTLNRLNGDSELIVMSAAGVAPFRLLKPFVVLTALVTILVAWMTMSVIPDSYKTLRDLITKVRADFVANIVKEGQFAQLDAGITFHYRERQGQTLIGIFLQDRRDDAKTAIYIAERGQAAEVDGMSLLLLERGSVQRQTPNSRDSSIVAFDRYAVNLAMLGGDADAEGGGEAAPGKIIYKPRERPLSALIFADKNEGYYKIQSGRFRAELHNRLSAPLYPIAFMLIAFAALGEAKTTRQGRGFAIQMAVFAVSATRLIGYAAWTASVRSPAAVPFMYLLPIGAGLISIWLILYGHRLKPITAPLVSDLLGRVINRLPKLGRA
ncbi:MAG: LPS export ABC transporter permease LptF, partial [Bosea sp. (in: a-proteobacteria)]